MSILQEEFFFYLNEFYKTNTSSVESFFKVYKNITEVCDINEGVVSKLQINEKLFEYFKYGNDGMGMVDSIRTVLNRFANETNNNVELQLLSIFLSVTIPSNSDSG